MKDWHKIRQVSLKALAWVFLRHFQPNQLLNIGTSVPLSVSYNFSLREKFVKKSISFSKPNLLIIMKKKKQKFISI